MAAAQSAALFRPRLTAMAVPRVYAQTALSKQMGWMPRMILSQSMPQFAHVFVGGNFGVDVVSLENQGERHGQDEKSDGQNRQKNYD